MTEAAGNIPEDSHLHTRRRENLKTRLHYRWHRDSLEYETSLSPSYNPAATKLSPYGAAPFSPSRLSFRRQAGQDRNIEQAAKITCRKSSALGYLGTTFTSTGTDWVQGIFATNYFGIFLTSCLYLTINIFDFVCSFMWMWYLISRPDGRAYRLTRRIFGRRTYCIKNSAVPSPVTWGKEVQCFNPCGDH
jgi:hypothetical protein